MAQAILGNPKLKFIKGMFYMPIPDPEQKYLTFEALEDGLQIKLSTNDCQYSLDDMTWINLPANTNTPTINRDQKIYFRGNLTPTTSAGIGTFNISERCNISGNIMSLLFRDNFEGQTDLTGYDYAFYKLFNNCNNIIDASQLILPATTLATYCYNNMFWNCTSLVAAPELPATTLANYCYFYMFSGCTSLVTAPELPATTLVKGCYRSMFDKCTSLTQAPELPATTLAESCYYYMFSDCTSLVSAPELPATTLAKECYYGMFNRCTSLTQAPELPAITLEGLCYSNMFSNCTKLNYIKALFTTTPSPLYTLNWVSGVSSTGTFVKNVDATWNVPGAHGIPSGWTVQTA
jgi:hypothetical protein